MRDFTRIGLERLVIHHLTNIKDVTLYAMFVPLPTIFLDENVETCFNKRLHNGTVRRNGYEKKYHSKKADKESGPQACRLRLTEKEYTDQINTCTYKVLRPRQRRQQRSS